jgi:hypothetical protein
MLIKQLLSLTKEMVAPDLRGSRDEYERSGERGSMAAKVSKEAEEASSKAFDPKTGKEEPGAHNGAAKLHAEASRQWNQLGNTDRADWHGSMARLHTRRAGKAWSTP